MFNLDKTLLFEQLENYQIQRHDFLNNFQVIRGYLQLNLPEKAIAYIDETIKDLIPQQEIYKIGQRTLMAVLLSCFFGLRLKGIPMKISFPPEMKSEEFWLERWHEEYALQFYGYTNDCINLIPQDESPEDLLAEIKLLSAPDGFAGECTILKKGDLYLAKSFSTITVGR